MFEFLLGKVTRDSGEEGEEGERGERERRTVVPVPSSWLGQVVTVVLSLTDTPHVRQPDEKYC